MNLPTKPTPSNRIGIHYFPDTVHYRDHDLQTWLPELGSLGVSWMTLPAPAGRAIPEFFLNGLLAAHIQPILHFQLPVGTPLRSEVLQLLFSNYARWGVRYVALYDQPNNRANWHPAAWAQTDLVERFLDLYLPFAEIALREGLIPVFPPLEPGGDYWDLAFLRTALRSIRRRGHELLLDKLHLGAYAWTGGRPLDWGAGGPDRWPGARPYFTSPGEQDHLGFHIFDWYLSISQLELGKRLPTLLLRAGSRLGESAVTIRPKERPDCLTEEQVHAQKNLALARQVAGDWGQTSQVKSIPSELKACNFWLLAANQHSPFASQAWFQAGSKELLVVDEFRRWVASRWESESSPRQAAPVEEDLEGRVVCEVQPKESDESRPIAHYVLLPLYAWGAADWDLEVIHPLLDGSHPTIGFSLAEARLATRVTVVGGEGAISEEALGMLRSSGCIVERLLRGGMLIAS